MDIMILHFYVAGGEKMPQSNSNSYDSKNQSTSRDTDQEKHNLPKTDLSDEN